MTYTSLFLGTQQNHEETMAQVMAYSAVELCAGDVIEYYCIKFVAGDPTGHRRATALQIIPGEDYPVHVDTDKVLWKLTMICRVATGSGQVIPREDRRRWTIGRFRLLEGTLNRPTHLQQVGRAIANAANKAIENVLRHPTCVAVNGCSADVEANEEASDDASISSRVHHDPIDGGSPPHDLVTAGADIDSGGGGGGRSPGYGVRASDLCIGEKNIVDIAAAGRPCDVSFGRTGQVDRVAVGGAGRMDRDAVDRRVNVDLCGTCQGRVSFRGDHYVGMSVAGEMNSAPDQNTGFGVESEAVMNAEFMQLPETELVDEPGKMGPPTLSSGMRFASGTLALYHVQAYALAHQKRVKVKRTSGIDSLIVCSASGDSSNCPFFVQVYKRQGGIWVISSLCLEHMDCVSSAKATTRQIAQLPTFASAVHADNSISASALIKLLSRRDGISLAGQERSVYRARAMVLNTTDDALRKSYELIDPYLDAFQRMNPGSTAMMDRDEDGRFKRAIILVRTVADSLPHNQQVLGVDCSHSKYQYYGGLQMHLVGRDGNMQDVTLAFALVPSKDIESYSWFFDNLTRSGIDLSGIPIFCDRNTALLSVAYTIDLNLKNCTAHIARNFVHENANAKQHHKVLVWQLQACYTEDEYNSRVAWIEMELGTEAMNYLKRIPPRRWCVFANISVQPGLPTLLKVQLALGIRGLPPFDFIKVVCSRIMSRALKHSQLSLKWSQEGRKITPAAMKIYDSQSQNIGHYLVDTASIDVHYVYNQRCSMRVLYWAGYGYVSM